MTQPIQFRDAAGNDLDWRIVGWSAVIAPKPITTPDIDGAADQAEPPGRIRKGTEAPSYKRGRLVFQGIPVVIENPKGSVRRGYGPDGKPWANELQAHYGFIARTFGQDGDGVDVFVGPDPDSDFVLIIHQVDPATGQPDEDKVCLGFSSALAAKTAYMGSYQKGWKGMGSVTPTTVQGLKDWIADGQTDRQILKSEPDADGCRWITVHHGGGEGQAIKVMPAQGHKGTWRVVGGAGGSLNGLRLHGLKSPEEYQKEAKERRQQQSLEKKKRQQDMTPEERHADNALEKETKSKNKEVRKKAETAFADKVLGPEQGSLLGDDGEPTPDDPKAQAEHHRERLKAAHMAVREAQKKLVLDVEARVQAGIPTIGGFAPHGLDIDDLVSEADPKGPGYQRALAKRAEMCGLTADKLAEQIADIKERRNAGEGKPSPAEPEQAKDGEKTALPGMEGAVGKDDHETKKAANIEAHKAGKEIQAHKAAATREAVKEVIKKNENLAALLQARKELRAVYKAATPEAKERVFAEGFQMAVGEGDTAALEQDVYQQMLTNNVVGFLREVGEAYPEGEPLDRFDPKAMEGLHATRGAAAFDALHEIALAAVGQGMIERDVVEALGPEGAAQLVGRGIRREFSPEDQASILEALEHHHLKEQEALPGVVDEAQALKAEANRLRADLAENPRDLTMAVEMQKNRLATLKEARRTLGGALGRLEARAALIADLQRGKDQDMMTLPLGKMTPEKAVQTAASMGMKEGDYKIDHESGEAVIHMNPQGQDRLVQPVDMAATHERDLALAIKGGQLDTPGYLPKGFADRTDSRYDHPIQEAPQFRKRLQVTDGMSPTEVHDALADHVGARIADGERPSDILNDVMSGTFMADSVHEGAMKDYVDTLQQVFPLQEQVKDKDGKPVVQKAEDGTEYPKMRLRTMEELAPHFDKMLDAYLTKQGVAGDAALSRQRVDADHPDFAEAVHRSLAEDPRTVAAFTPPGELTPEHQSHIRDYFYREIKGVDPEAHRAKAESQVDGPPDKAGEEPKPKAAAQTKDEKVHTRAMEIAGPQPEEWEVDMFGEQTHSPVWVDWKARYDGAKEAAENGQDGDLEANTSTYIAPSGQKVQASAAAPQVEDSPWAQYVQAMGGLKQAQAAVQDSMKGAFAQRFKAQHERLTGKGLKLGQTDLAHRERFIGATMDPDKLAAMRKNQASLATGLRKRDSRGRLQEGAVADMMEEARKKRQAALQGQAPLFEKEEEPGLRPTLGPTLEAQIRAHIPGLAVAFEGIRRGMNVHEKVAMDGDKKVQQRAIRAIIHLQRQGLFLGAGSGKTPIMLGSLTELHHSGKVKKSILAVPSIVQKQFGAEAIRFIDPNSGFHVHAQPGESYEERLRAYQDPDKHAVVVTHQSLRDDTLHILGDHLGMDPERTHDWAMSVPKDKLANTVKEAFAKAGIDFQALMVDEAHGALDRLGKEDSTFSRIMDAHSRNVSHMVMATADPMKNDVSEIYSDLNHLDPHNYPDEGKDEFMRRFGGDAELCKRSLAQQLTRYWTNGRVTLPKEAHRVDDGIELEPHQHEAVAKVDMAVGKLRTGAEGEERLKWAKELAPEAFEGHPEGDHEAIAKMVARSVGTFRESAMNRIINLDPAGGKMIAAVKQAKDAKAEGKPMVIFARNLGAVASLHKNLEAAGLKVASLTGKDSSKNKGEKVSAYQRGENDVIVMSDAGAVGANLQEGKILVNYDQANTAMLMNQRQARINRIGQTDNVEIRHLLANHSWEKQNTERVKRKDTLGAVFQRPEGFLDDTGLAGDLREIRARRNQERVA